MFEKFAKKILVGLGYKGSPIQIRQGNIHHIFRSEDNSAVLKIRDVRCSEYPDIALTPSDIEKEIKILIMLEQISSEADVIVPQVIEYCIERDRPSWFVMTKISDEKNFLSSDFDVAAKINGWNMGYFLGKKLGDMHKVFQRQFDDKTCPHNKDSVDFLLPYLKHRLGNFYSDDLYTDLCNGPRQCVHGDFCSKNISIEKDKLAVVDWEYFHWGSPIFEIGFFLADISTFVKSFKEQDSFKKDFYSGYESVCPGFIQGREHILEKVINLSTKKLSSRRDQEKNYAQKFNKSSRRNSIKAQFFKLKKWIGLNLG
jgi:tRNA A-37 threonylcarbamoyl transferase component Bud32